MHPRTIGILVGSILLLGLVMRVVIFRTGLLPVSEELILKKATSLTIGYTTAAGPKSLTINQPEQLVDLFAVLELRPPNERHDRMEQWGGGGGGMVGASGAVTFHFPDGTSRTLYFQGSNWLGRSEVNPRFYDRLREQVSRAEGRPVRFLQENPLDAPWIEKKD